MTITWSPLALERAQEIVDFMAADDPGAAQAWVHDLFNAVGHLDDFPQSGRMVPEIRRQDLRELVWKRHRIIYRVREGQVSILTIIHGRQHLDPTDLR